MHRSLRCRLLGHRSDCRCDAGREEDPRPEYAAKEASPVAQRASDEYRRKKFRR